MNNPKFRIYDKRKKEWLLGYKQLGGFSLVGEVMLFEEWARILSERMEWLNELDIMQSTGLKDKNGVEIFCGDIVDIKNTTFMKCFDVKEHSGVFGVVFPDSRHCALRDFSDIEIIGNVWDNP